MSNFSVYFNQAYSAVASLPFDTLVLITAGALGSVFVVTLLACALSRGIRSADKRPFFHLVNAFTAIALSVFLTELDFARAVAATAVFWVAGYLLYGLLCAVTGQRKRAEEVVERVVSSMPVAPPRQPALPDIPAAQNNVRLEHALSIADKLLLKNLAMGDRQELEKMKTTLTVMQIKGTLSPQEGEILNDSFNALLKLMAKYNM